MKVQTDLEVKHFIEYVGTMRAHVGMHVLDKKDGFHVVNINKEEFQIHEDALPLIQTKCSGLKITNRILH